MSDAVRMMVELGPKGKKSVAYAIDWPGWSRGAKTPDRAIDVLEAYRQRYRPIAELAGFGAEFDAAGPLTEGDRYTGTGSTDFWGISFAASPEEGEGLSERQLERRLALLQAAWAFFDRVASRVSPELKKGPRGGGRDRDKIINHVLGWERSGLAVNVGIEYPEGVLLDPDVLRQYRNDYVGALREHHARGQKARKLELSYLIRHSAFHMLDHAWEMEDKDLSAVS
ncbi:MAG: hypothetical protein AVDCRST_MAG33-1520 [uncultured Thermomicrobiales bacterium]|uniref:Uncharacterized protein n=1 Tax=uncultured Thermomicrobiales bacterium TaxID=1645740 RepID=A0A6J4UUU0_9BACT|nr:MAG: hypothetical protein AVDCRST_MAG33-1520 [uncultured Thermomicrobiales bacterium]